MPKIHPYTYTISVPWDQSFDILIDGEDMALVGIKPGSR